MKFPQRLRVLLMAAALFLASLACNLPGGTNPSEAPTPTPIPVSTEAVESLEDEIESAAQGANETGQINVTVTESQLTSLVAFELQSQAEPILTEPQVYLRNGQIELNGKVSQGGLTAPLKLTMTVSVSAEGKPQYEVVSGSLGPLPLPDALLDELTTQLDTALAERMGSETENMVVEDIAIADGQMTITGQTRQ